MSQKPSLPKGTRDFAPEVMLRREYIFDTLRGVFRKYGYQPLETPAIERLDVLTGKYGEEGDRLIFKILNSGDFLKGATELEDYRKLTPQISEKALRYDLTVPFARFVVMNQNDLAFPFRRYQIQPVWRGDRPGKGRYREFYQCDADVVGSDSLLFEAEFIAIFDEALSRLDMRDFSIRISNRKILSGYAEVVGQSDKFQDICVAIDKLDKIGKEGVSKELQERGITPEACNELLQMITYQGNNEARLAYLDNCFKTSETGQRGLAELREILALRENFTFHNAKVEFDLTLARGLNYYTGTIFEVVTNEMEMGSICGGGRYDDLTGVFGMPGLSGVGISFGVARIYDVLEELGRFGDQSAASTQVMLVNFGEETLKTNLKALNRLRDAGIAAELYPDNSKLKKQFSYADKKGIPYTLMIGTAEMASGEYQLKNMRSGEQQGMKIEQIIERMTE